MRGFRILVCALGFLLIGGCTQSSTQSLSPGVGSSLMSLVPSTVPSNQTAVETPEGSISIPLNNDQGLTIEAGALTKMTEKGKLFGSEQESIIALINLPLVAGEGYTGYLGIWDLSGNLIQKLEVKGYNIIDPEQIHVEDITGDGIADIVLETNEGANGGLGVHALNVYVGDKDKYTEVILAGGENIAFKTTYVPERGEFSIVSVQDNRSWMVKLPKGERMDFMDVRLFTGTHALTIDPIGAVAWGENTLTTKRLVWFGNLQLNSLAVLATSYHYQDGKMLVQSYHLESDGSSVITEK
ncbi:MAG: hypothetical protein K6T85_03540 [Gorillibacterium sp.]|nr:hypothetical protein [Gorillibacterium sp.]